MGEGANPWAEQFFSDLRQLHRTESGAEFLAIAGEKLAVVFEHGIAAEAFANVDLTELRALLLLDSDSLHVSEELNDETREATLCCGIEGCSATFDSRHKLQLHLRRAHTVFSVVSLCVNSKCCPCCGTILATKVGAVKHLARSVFRGHCMTHRAYNIGSRIEPKNHDCRVCGLE